MHFYIARKQDGTILSSLISKENRLYKGAEEITKEEYESIFGAVDESLYQNLENTEDSLLKNIHSGIEEI